MNSGRTVGVIGLGTMGLGIAQVYAQAGFPVTATDAHAPARESAKARLARILDARVAAGKLAGEERDAILARITIADDISSLAAASLIIEAIAEDLDAKRGLFAALEPIAAEDAVLATNTSSLPVGAIAEGLTRKERAVGLHFFNPAPAMKLVELAIPAGAAAEAIGLARRITEAAGKTVIACADRPGFIVNRCARPFYGEALALLEEGRTASDIDAAMMAIGYRIGPFGLIDLIGADINLAATQGLWRAMAGHPRYHVFDALARQVKAGRLGRKTGQGFIYPSVPGAPPADAEAIALRIEAALVNEACALLDEGGVDEAGIDTAMKLGLNFPRGPFAAGRARGWRVVRQTLDALEAAAPPHLKGRYALSAGLRMRQ